MMFSGVHRDTFLGVPATGRRVAWAGAAFFTFDDGLISDLWVLGDLYGLHEQLRRPE
jgi:predicted ester cyclase